MARKHEDKNDKDFIKKAKARLKKRRPEYKKKRVIVPSRCYINYTRYCSCNTLYLFSVNR